MTDVYVFPTRDESGSIGAPLSVFEALGVRRARRDEQVRRSAGAARLDARRRLGRDLDEQFVPAVQRLVKSAPSAKALYSMDWAALASTVIDTVCEGHR